MSMAETVLRLPPNLAIGVRAPETTTMSSGRLSKVRLLMFFLPGGLRFGVLLAGRYS